MKPRTLEGLVEGAPDAPVCHRLSTNGEAATPVRTDGDFATIVQAVDVGRVIGDTVVKFTRVQRSTSCAAQGPAEDISAHTAVGDNAWHGCLRRAEERRGDDIDAHRHGRFSIHGR